MSAPRGEQRIYRLSGSTKKPNPRRVKEAQPVDPDSLLGALSECLGVIRQHACQPD